MSATNEPLHVYEIDDGALTLVVAESEEKALSLFGLEAFGESSADFWLKESAPRVRQLPDDSLLKLILPDEPSVDEQCAYEEKTCREWIAEGRGILGGTEQ